MALVEKDRKKGEKGSIFERMNLFNKKASPVQLQLLVWGVILVINFFSYLPMDGIIMAATYTVFNTCCYALIIYGNISFLYPRYYEKKRYVLYIFLTTLFLLITGVSKALISQFIYNHFFAVKKEPVTAGNIIYVATGSLVIFILSFVFRIALAYFKLKQQAEQMQEQKSLAELNLLKSQVQPHFLFNTLNNIYYEAFLESPRTALLIGRLSEIMRYFVDESPKERVALATEMQFLENYIALEKIRIRHGVKVVFIKEIEGDHTIPPMLLMTFVENIFKHGIDRSGIENQITLSLLEREGYLLFQTENKLPEIHTSTIKVGFGIKNLQKRLTLLYGTDFELNVVRSEPYYHAFLKIPLV
ncbi:sensor histidine kinase [Flavitalea flava]